MSKQDTETRTRFETILGRLVARNEQLDRQLESALRRAKIPLRIFDNVEQRLARVDPRVVKEARDRLERELAAVRPEPLDRSDKPSFAELAARFRGRLVRA